MNVPERRKAGNAHGIGLHRLSENNGNMLENVALIYIIFYNSTASRGALILDTVYGEVKIGVHRDGAGYACEVLRELKEAAK